MKSKSQKMDDFLDSWIEFNKSVDKKVSPNDKKLRVDLFKIYMDLNQKWINVRYFEGE